ncbi:hypothetical protein DB313_04915 (plasmid) [Borrelia turcica IST7]|uniref:Uncharacterized protein n=1 Tax=Borrelia turcica IST7 TaxID=1104446 RepID=A0A386PNI0_9SPIR|nr:hypothetical protein [Borrelia turcica]AYE36842.1 hypothetical protein DB313_04915 [Borrelia turcica IST7]
MKIYRVLLILLVILMGCSQQAPKEKAGEKTGITKTGKKRKQKGIKKNKLDEKPVDDETSDNNSGEEEEISDNDTGEEANSGDGEEETLYSTLEKKVKELREKLERAKNKFKEEERPFPNEEERSRLFPNVQESKRALRAYIEKEYSFFNIVKLMKSQNSHKYPDEVDDIYAGLEYDAGLLTEVDKMIPKLNHKGQSSEPFSFYHHFLFVVGEVGEFNREVLYEYLSDAKLAKLKSGSEADIVKANELLDEFMKKKAYLLELIKAQIKAVENKKKRDDFYMKFINPRVDEITDAYDKLRKSRKNIEEFCSKLNN